MFHVRIMCVSCIYHSGIIAISFPYLKVHITDILPFIRTYLSSIITWYHTAYKPYIITYLEISRDPYHAPYHRPYHKSVISRRDTGRPGWPHDTARESDTRKRNISYAYQTSISPTVYRAISLRIVFHIIRGWYRYDMVWYWSTGKVDDMYRKSSHSPAEAGGVYISIGSHMNLSSTYLEMKVRLETY